VWVKFVGVIGGTNELAQWSLTHARSHAIAVGRKHVGAIVVGIRACFDGSANAVGTTRGLIGGETRFTEAIANDVAANVVGAESAGTHTVAIACDAAGQWRRAASSGAEETSLAIGVDRARIEASRGSADEGRAGSDRNIDACPVAVAHFGGLFLVHRARRWGANASGDIKLAGAAAIAGTVCPACRNAGVIAVVVRIESRDDVFANAIGAGAFGQRRTCLASAHAW
jgi:hypothetical protein